MPYSFYLGETLLPVTPAKLQLKIKGNNKTVTLINDGEVNIIKNAGLTAISFEALLPNVRYPFDNNGNTIYPANYYMEILEKLKTEKKPFQFIVTRTKPSGDYLFDTNIKVSLEDYTLNEDAEKYGMDISVSISLKQYRDYSTKILTLKSKSTISSTSTITGSSTSASTGSTEKIANISQSRASSKKISKTHTVKSGESLWAICQKELGDGSKYADIAKLNNIANPNLIKVGQVIKLG